MPTPPPTARAETPMAFILAMVKAYERRGMDPSGALHAAQITPKQLKNPDARVTALQMEWMSAAAMRELDDEALGWFSRKLPWGSHGLAQFVQGVTQAEVQAGQWACGHAWVSLA